jgi:HSP20 family protein
MALTLRRQDDRAGNWDPFEEAERLQTQLARLLDGAGTIPIAGMPFVPAADVEETDDAYIIELELPGVKRDDVDVQFSAGRLIVTGERKEKERAGLLRRRTRKVGEFRYEIQLPPTVDESGVSAHLDQGELIIRVPKSAADQPRRIKVD